MANGTLGAPIAGDRSTDVSAESDSRSVSSDEGRLDDQPSSGRSSRRTKSMSHKGHKNIENR